MVSGGPLKLCLYDACPKSKPTLGQHFMFAGSRVLQRLLLAHRTTILT